MKKYGVIRFAKKEASRKVIQDVADAYKLWAESGIRPEIDWILLRRADAAYAAAAAARQEWRNAQADKLIELMQNAPVLAVSL